RPSARRNAFRPSPQNRAADPPSRSSIADRLGAFLFNSPIGIAVVDRDYDIQAINQAARSFLGIYGQGIGEDLIHLSAEIAPGELKRALDTAFRSELPNNFSEIRVPDTTSDSERVLQFACYPDRSVSSEGTVGAVIALIIDVTDGVHHRENLERQNRQFATAVADLTKQNVELQNRQRSLMDANKELTTSNDELRSSNEHLMVAAEEAEAAAEEVETLNEEMQATGEELETLNEELQATVEELNATNEELQARGNDLERQAAEQEAEVASKQARIDLVTQAFAGVPAVAALLDGDSVVIATTAQYDALAAQNTGILRAKGERWSPRPKRIALTHDGVESPHHLEFLPGPAGGGLFLIAASSPK
ncbi:MAG TPA: PAS domain-containing protein, partial [Candidatus Tumulicola sp.]|nr:PAS domain-containing protein [Candidatus Tumulicola sp.]